MSSTVKNLNTKQDIKKYLLIYALLSFLFVFLLPSYSEPDINNQIVEKEASPTEGLNNNLESTNDIEQAKLSWLDEGIESIKGAVLENIDLYSDDELNDEPDYIKPEKINFLSYSELQELSKNPYPNDELKEKLHSQFTIPYIENKNRKTANISFNDENQTLKLVHWNINRGYFLDAIKSLSSHNSEFYEQYHNNIKEKSQTSFLKEIDSFASGDIISLNEVDVGVHRTDYKNVVAELSDALDYNYAFATEFIEVGPLISKKETLDPDRYTGLHGNAIISKYPIVKAKVLSLPECYNWLNKELKRKSVLEYARRLSARAIFSQPIFTEVRYGNRNALVSEILLPTGEVITYVTTHLEDRCTPKCREKQVSYILENIKDYKGPVVLAGDLNTSTSDTSPTSFIKEVVKRVKDPHYLARQAALFFVPMLPPGAGSTTSFLLSKVVQYKDPVVPSIPILFPNQERKLFTTLRNFHFSDNETFDFRGEKEKSSNGRRGLLANSNERYFKGFRSTYKLNKPRAIAYFKLDWFFVKPSANRFEPFNGQTLRLVNKGLPGRISDHDPIAVELKLGEIAKKVASK